MNNTIFITATGTGVGKTYTAERIISYMGRMGVRPGVFKPIETGVEDIPSDAERILRICKKYNSDFEHFSANDICAYIFSLPAAPFCADRDKIIDIETITKRAKELKKSCDVLVVEGAGGLMVPIKEDYYMADLAKELDAFTLLVTHSGLGCINETLCSLKLLESSGLEYDWCVNVYRDRDSFPAVTKPFYDTAIPGWWSVEDGLDMFVSKITAGIGKSS